MKTEIKNLKKAAQRIKKAVKGKENIVLYGDADLDGTVSLLILEEALKSLGAKPFLYFPERGVEGYGLNEEALKFIGKYAPALLVLMDCGIGNFKEVKQAKKMGFEVIIVDHHEILDGIPQASIVVDPKQKGDKYPFKFLAACGLSFKLTELLLGDKLGGGSRREALSRSETPRLRVASNQLRQSFLELVALATLADMMPQVEDNYILIENGLSSLSATFRPGLRVFLKSFDYQDLSSRELAAKIISILQITEIEDHLTESYLLLSIQDEREANRLLEVLLEKNIRRRQIIAALTEEISQKISLSPSLIVFEGSAEVPQSSTGSLASRLKNKFKKPTFIFNSNQILSRGSVRMPKGVDSLRALKHCHSLLEVYGGHPQASGFTVKNENLNKFKQCLIGYFEKL